MKMRRTPFYGDAGDRELLGPSFKLISVDEMTDVPPAALDLVGSMGDGSAELEAQELIPGAVKPLHPDYREMGTGIPLGFIPHQGENRRQRLAGVATWVPPEEPEPTTPLAPAMGPAPRMPTRRELLAQRKKHRRGKLDPELRRLQKAKLRGT